MRLLAILLLGTSCASYAYEDLVTSQLIEEAVHWQSKGRADLAAESWRRILVNNPNHAQAIVNLGLIAGKAGNLDEAASLYNRAKKLAKPPAGLNQLAALLVKGRPDGMLVPPTVQAGSKVGIAVAIKPPDRTNLRHMPKDPIKTVENLNVLPPKASPPPLPPVQSASSPTAIASTMTHSGSFLIAATGLTPSPQRKDSVDPNKAKAELPLQPQPDIFSAMTRRTPVAQRPRPCRQLSVDEANS